MKAQFKYAFMAGLFARGPVFAVIFVMNTVFIILGSLNMLPIAAHITAVSLCGVGIAVMLAVNIIGDIAIARRMFSSPEAYLHALTPVPRHKPLLAGVITMAAMDLVTMVYMIIAQVWLSLNMVGREAIQEFWNEFNAHNNLAIYIIGFILLGIAAYLFILMVIMFCVTAKKSIFYTLPASGFLALLLACACFYANNLLQLFLVPFSDIQRHLFFIILTPESKIMFPVLILLTLLEAGVLFVLSSKLLERRVNL